MYLNGKGYPSGSTTGKLGEDLACRYLEEKGWRIRRRNYFNAKGYRQGEIDIVAQEHSELVFVEVKTTVVRSGGEWSVDERITPAKLAKLERMALRYLNSQGLAGTAYRFDAVMVAYFPREVRAQIRHVRNMFL
jgi:putative endonuclease